VERRGNEKDSQVNSEIYNAAGHSLAVKRFEQRLRVNKKLRHLTDQVDKALRL